ncbi:hypothetical protein FHL15_006834 [Xylaria flabelliformis]|uniref:Carrier domain-containing protein n=1 Tax=Xylaria flabelliformis TaxID=2512241 RepID=A0A553HW83_9PEZI|nr:hypothetical protein FHL15_006834 [Xylaria flabelliformis]
MLSPDEYWRKALAGCEHTPYPSLPSFIDQPQAIQVVQYRLRDLEQCPGCVTTSTLIHAAWALITSCMTDSEDVVFGVTVPEEHDPLPFRIQLKRDQSIEKYLEAIRQQASEMIPFATMGLAGIAKVSSDCREACLFQTVLDIGARPDKSSQLQKFGLTILFQVNGTQIDVSASLDPRMIEPQLAYKLLHRLGYVMQQLDRAKFGASLADVDMVPPQELNLIQEWNSIVPPVAEKCIHNVIRDQASARPGAPAVSAWDGEMTYQELEDLSTNVAYLLIEAGVGPEKVVPLCFEKSKWTVVAMLSVLKAGAAFILLDRSLPAARIQSICRQVNAETCITSVSCEPQLSPFVHQTIVLCQQTAEVPVSNKRAIPPHITNANPRNAAYIIFTSGSTGEPKGCVIEHQSYCSAAFGHGEILGMNSETRALQFGSYNFAGAIMETIMTLIYGGCVCIPSDEDRTTALAQAIRKLNANWAFLTATVLALIHPEDVPSLRTICVGGEPIRNSQIKEWSSHVQLRQTYGSAETAAVVASAGLNASSTVGSVGKSTTARCWLTHPADVNQLVPIGAPGEVIFEGPVIGREYIGNPEKSSQAFISAPTWRAAFGTPATSSRFYRTGDIAVYRSDGSLELQGRKDTQVKIRGQRVELGEIEHQARLTSSGLKEVAVDIGTVDGRPTLICFLVVASIGDTTTRNGETSNELSRNVIQTVRSRLESILPHYMVPSVFLSIPAFPHTISGKLDRKKLRSIGSTMAVQQLQESRSAAGTHLVQPSSETERQLQQIWSKVLKTEQGSIGLDTSFFQLGGDSITAMKVITEARRHGMYLTMEDIFRSDTIAGLAYQQSLNANSAPQPDSGEFLDESLSMCVLDDIDLNGTGIQREDVEAIYPLTGVQDLLVANSKSTGILADYFVLDLDPELDLSRLESGCRRAFQSFPVLRACWLRLQERHWQVVLRKIDQPFHIINVSGNMAEFCQNFCLADMKALLPTQPTATWFLLTQEHGDMKLVLRMSHAQYDAFSMPLIFESVFDDYEGKDAPTQPTFPAFLSHASRQRSRSIAYWSRVLKGSQLTRVVPHILSPSEALASEVSLVVAQTKAQLPSRPNRITPATLVRAAWAITLSGLTGAADIAFGQVIAGRNARIPQIEKIVGCCLNIVPERVNLSSFTTVAELLRASQEQMLKMNDADTLNYRDILKYCTDWPSEETFDSILHHRDVDAEPEISTPKGVSRIQTLALPQPPPFLFIVSTSKGDHIGLELFGNTHMLTQETAQKLVNKLAHITEKLSASMDISVSSLMDEARLAI